MLLLRDLLNARELDPERVISANVDFVRHLAKIADFLETRLDDDPEEKSVAQSVEPNDKAV
jgi:hypothetical protein